MAPPAKKQKEEATKPDPPDFMMIDYPRSGNSYFAKNAVMKKKGFSWTAEVVTSWNDNTDECVSVKIRNNMSDDTDLWYCDVKIILLITNLDSTKNIFYQEQFFRFNPQMTEYLFKDVFVKDEFLADEGFFNLDETSRISIGIQLHSIKGDKFIKRASIDWSDEMTGSDCCLEVDGKDFYVGKHMLVRHASYFDSLFYGGFKEEKMTRIPLQEISKESFELFLNYIHHFEGVTMNANTVWNLLELAHQFEAKAVLLDAEKFLMNTREMDLTERLVMADKFQMYALKDSCLREYTNINQINQVRYSEHYSTLSDDTKEAINDTLLKIANQLAQNQQMNNSLNQQQNIYGGQYQGPSTSSYQPQPPYMNRGSYPPGFNQGPSTSYAPPQSSQFFGGPGMPNNNPMMSSSSMPGSSSMMGSTSIMSRPSHPMSSIGSMGIPPGFSHLPPAPPVLLRKPPVKRGRMTKAATAAAAAAALAAAQSS